MGVGEILQQAKRVYFSDSHIPRNNSFFREWLGRVLDESKAKVVGLGDVFELVECYLDEVLEKGKAEIDLLKELRKQDRLTLFYGNHDEVAGGTYIAFDVIGLTRHYEKAMYEDFLLLHGHQFDPVCRYGFIWKVLSKILPWFVTPGRAKYGQKEKLYYKSVARVIMNAVKERKNIIMGHTHWAGIVMLESGKKIINLGDMLDSCTWLAEVGDRFVLMKRWEVIHEVIQLDKHSNVYLEQLTSATKEAIKGDKDKVEIGYECKGKT